MAFANADSLSKVVGCFTNAETKTYFEYRYNESGCFLQYPHEVFVGPNAESTRIARVLKTVAYVVIDEDEYGNPVEEKWAIRAHRDWSQQ